MNTARLALTNNNTLILVNGTLRPSIIINMETLERIRNFQSAHPDIDNEFLSKELNTAIVEMLFRIEREFNGE